MNAKHKTNELGWMDAGDGYGLALDDGKLLCRNAKGAVLSSVPAKVKSSPAAEQLLALRDWLAAHELECKQQVELWMLRSLQVPRALLRAVWDDVAWSGALRHLVVTDGEVAGILSDVDASRGIGVVDVDGESQWLRAESIGIPHPTLLEALDDFRELLSELQYSQAVQQLFRETHPMPEKLAPETTSIGDFANGKFAALTHAMAKAKALGYRVRGGYAVCPVWADGRVTEARYWIGSDSPESETYTGELLWVDGREQQLPVQSLNRVAYSEGMRMAASLYAARVVEKSEVES